MLSDVDEIPNYNFFYKFRGNLTIFKQYMLYFHMNLRCTGFELDYGDGLWGGTRMLYFKDFKGAQKIRNIKPKSIDGGELINQTLIFYTMQDGILDF